MIKYHYHTAVKDLPKAFVAAGDRMCRVYSDASESELLTWCVRNRVSTRFIDRRRPGLPFLDLWGRRLRLCGPGVSDGEIAQDLRRLAAGDSPRRERAPKRRARPECGHAPAFWVTADGGRVRCTACTAPEEGS